MRLLRILPFKLLLVVGISSAMGFPSNLLAQEQTSTDQPQPAENELWCNEHDAAEKDCFICHPKLRDKGRLWCNEHKRYEDRCWLCHPELEDKERAYCEKHFLYLDECQHLHSENSANTSIKMNAIQPVPHSNSSGLYCKEHDLPEKECALCHPELLTEHSDGTTLKVRLPSKDTPDLVGIKTVFPKKSDLPNSIHALGEITFNQNKTAKIVAPVPGVIKTVQVDLGDTLEKDQELLRIWSPSIAKTVSEALFARQTLDRVRHLREKSITSAGELEKAEAKYRSALQELKSLGFADEQLKKLNDDPNAPIMLRITAPFAGEVVARNAVQGEYVTTGHPLFTLSDRSEVWAMLNVPEKHLSSIALGQSVKIHSEAFPNEKFIGTITHVSASIDQQTRMAVVRVSLKNHSRKLRENMFVTARIEKKQQQHALLIPAHSVQNIDGTTVVFTEIDKDLYEVRPVTLGDNIGEYTQIFSGITESQQVVSVGSQAVKSHFLISRLGAGCVH